MAQQITNAGLTFNYLQPNDCIGDSLGFFNANLTNLITLVNNLSSNLYTVTSNISAAVPASPTVAKAWTVFDASRNTSYGSDTATTNRFLSASYNIASVLKTGLGTYTINFSTPIATPYVVLATVNGPGYSPSVNNSQNFVINTISSTGFTAVAVTGGVAASDRNGSFVVYSLS